MSRPDEEAIALLKKLIATPSTSRDESATAGIIRQWLADNGHIPARIDNNIYALAAPLRPELPTVMLNSHHDTVKPSPAYTRDPYMPEEADGRIYGLGSNDAGASLVSLLAAFHLADPSSLPFNLLMAVTAEEEVGGEHGMRSLLPHLAEKGLIPSMVIVGEPTGLQAAVAERGLVVLDCIAHGVSGHAARNEGVNAIYRAMTDIERLRTYSFPRVSDVLGPIKISVTQIEAGRQHNVIPDECRFVVDVRTTDAYSNEETARMLADLIDSECAPRSTRVQASVISPGHPLVAAATDLGAATFVSPTTSDMSLLHGIPSLKIGPGRSERSHTADEYVMRHEITEAIDFYSSLISNLKNHLQE